MKHVFVFDQDKCSACSACMMGCLDQNDTDLAAGDKCFRQTFDNEIPLADGGHLLCLHLRRLHALRGRALHPGLPGGVPVQGSGDGVHGV